jgi:hypothetical protein
MKTYKFKISENAIRKSEDLLEEGKEIILDFGKYADPEDLTHILTYLHQEYKVEVSMRHAELEEILESAVIGGVTGGALGILAALIWGGPVGILAALGTILGGLLGASSAVLNVKIYKYRGNTLMKLSPE